MLNAQLRCASNMKDRKRLATGEDLPKMAAKSTAEPNATASPKS